MIIKTENLSKTYGKFTAVRDINLHVPQGSIYCFLGPNGAGKTTTIRMLLGLVRPTAGSVNLFGQPVIGRTQEMARQVGSLVESPSYYPHLTARENLELARRLRGAEKGQVAKVLAMVGLEKDSMRLARHYSLGMCQRLGLALALLGGPQLIVLDEPTNGLDPAGIHEIRDLLRRLPEEHGVTLFVSSHLLSEVEQIATCIGIIQQGRLLFEGTPEKLRADYCDSLSIGVDRPDEACRELQAAGWAASRGTNHHLSVSIQKPEEAARVNHRLVSGGFQIYELTHNQLSLEDIFLQMTRQENQKVIVKN